jgi:guanylate kinase
VNIRRKGILFVISAPSGAGKTTLCNGLRQSAEFVFSVSCTTRPRRPGEVEGEDYYFLRAEEFEKRVQCGDFLEHAQVHGHRYGTLRATVVKNLEQGIDVLLDIDTQGAATIRATNDPAIQEALVDIFLMPPSFDELRHRLLRRATETPEQIETRLSNARREMPHWRDYRYTIVSGAVEEDLHHFRVIMGAERQLSRRLQIE